MCWKLDLDSPGQCHYFPDKTLLVLPVTYKPSCSAGPKKMLILAADGSKVKSEIISQSYLIIITTSIQKVKIRRSFLSKCQIMIIFVHLQEVVF